MSVLEAVRAYVSLQSLTAGRIGILLLLTCLLVASNLLGANPYIDPGTLSLGSTLALGLSALTMSMADRLTPAQQKAWRNRVILAGVSLLVAAAAAEAATRFVFRQVRTSADDDAYFSRQWVRKGYVFLNGYGFRERQFSAIKPPNTYRIAVAGDSLTFGNGLESRERYSDLLQQWLPEGFEVLNFGFPGDNTPQHAVNIPSRVLPVNPDYVLLQWFVNDIEGDDVERRPVMRPLTPMPVHDWLHGRSALYSLANMRWAEFQVAAGLTASYTQYLEGRAGDPDGEDARREAALLTSIIDACRRQGVGIGFVLFPDVGLPLDDSYPFAYLHDRVLDVCRAEGLTCLDLRPAFAAIGDRRLLWVSPFDHHPSPRANSIAAVKVLEVFQREWVK